MTHGQWYLALAFAFFTLAVSALSWQANNVWNDRAAEKRQRAADERTAAARGFVLYEDEWQKIAQLEQRAPMPTTRGWLYDTAWRPVQRDTEPMSIVAALDMADAAYRLGQDRAAADQSSAEVDAIWAEVDAHPEQWRQT